MDKLPTILVTAYAINPYKGSEDGMGWNMILQIARFQKVIAITRENNAEAINQYIKEHQVPNVENIQFEYFDTPYYTRFWKRGGRGALLYFYIWQYAVARWVKSQNWQYDIVHNLNFHNDWTPSFLWSTKKPFVWGPIGHHPQIPAAFLKQYGLKTVMKEGIRWAAKQAFWRFDPFLKLTKKKAAHIFAMNSSVAEVLHLPETKVSILPSVATESVEISEKIENPIFNILSIGRFVSLKGFDVTIKSFARFLSNFPARDWKNFQLTLVGKGPTLPYLEQLIEEAGITDVVKVIDWVERRQLQIIYEAADVFLFPSHEGAGMVVAEAMSYGLPVVCFDNCGPGEFTNSHCGLTIPYQSYEVSVSAFADALMKLYKDESLRKQLSFGAIRHSRQNLSWNRKGLVFRAVYQSILQDEETTLQNEFQQQENHVYSPPQRL